jgi:hypothetical protein
MIDNRKDQKGRARQALCLPQTICKFGRDGCPGIVLQRYRELPIRHHGYVGGVYETEGHRICWRRFDPDAFGTGPQVSRSPSKAWTFRESKQSPRLQNQVPTWFFDARSFVARDGLRSIKAP